MPGDPFSPGAVSFVIANEKVFWSVLVHPTTLSLSFFLHHEEVMVVVEAIVAYMRENGDGYAILH
jgi:hypothetical protein